MRDFLDLWVKKLEELAKDDSGVTSVEYAMIAGSVTLAIVFALSDIQSSLTTMFTAVSSGFK